MRRRHEQRGGSEADEFAAAAAGQKGSQAWSRSSTQQRTRSADGQAALSAGPHPPCSTPPTAHLDDEQALGGVDAAVGCAAQQVLLGPGPAEEGAGVAPGVEHQRDATQWGGLLRAPCRRWRRRRRHLRLHGPRGVPAGGRWLAVRGGVRWSLRGCCCKRGAVWLATEQCLLRPGLEGGCETLKYLFHDGLVQTKRGWKEVRAARGQGCVGARLGRGAEALACRKRWECRICLQPSMHAPQRDL